MPWSATTARPLTSFLTSLLRFASSDKIKSSFSLFLSCFPIAGSSRSFTSEGKLSRITTTRLVQRQQVRYLPHPSIAPRPKVISEYSVNAPYCSCSQLLVADFVAKVFWSSSTRGRPENDSCQAWIASWDSLGE